MSEKSRKRLEHQLYLAKENPEPIFDVSNCELTSVPVGCFSLCKVLRKKKLFLNNNHIKLLNSNGNNIPDLTVLTHLHLEHNDFEKLPEDICSIQFLQVLNVSNNKLTSLPSSMGRLLYLSQLYIQNNYINELPTTLLTPSSNLEVLNVSENPNFTSIPVEIFNVPKLRKFDFSAQYLKFPSQDICRQGFKKIMKVLCKEYGITSNSLFMKQNSNSEQIDADIVDSSVLDFEKSKQNRLEFLKYMENEYEHLSLSQKSLTEKALNDRNAFINKLFEEEAKNISYMSQMQKEKDLHREQLINDVKAAENDAAHLIQEIIAMNKKCQSQEKLLDEMEHENMKKYQLYQISKDELEQLRRQEILNAMSKILVLQDIDKTFDDQCSFRNSLRQQQQLSSSISDEALSELMNERRQKQKQIISQLEHQEKEQKAAFQQLQLQKDIRTLRLTEYIYSVESELILLSQVEQKKRPEQEEFKFSTLNEHRKQLAELLENFIQQKVERERVLFQRMLEIEEQRKKDQSDFWLIQYQRCLDNKPDNLWEKFLHIDELVKELLNRANATEYLPLFLKHKISWDQVEKFQENDWIKIGVNNINLRKKLIDIVKEIQIEKAKKTKSYENDVKLSKIDKVPCENKWPSMFPGMIASHRETECCICLNEETTILFMPCAHICCCDKCSRGIKECPLCRTKIIRLIKLMCW